VVVPIWRSDEEKELVLEAVGRVERMLCDAVALHVDRREGYSPGWKYNEWELRGVPLRIEVGPRDVRQDQVMLARRDIPGRAGKSPIPMEGLATAVRELLDAIQDGLFQRALDFRQANTCSPNDYDEFAEAVSQGFAESWWCEDDACEAQIKDDTKATVRCIPMDQEGSQGRCIHCGQDARVKAIFARAY
jgi:prolyl-tRNA synthetase